MCELLFKKKTRAMFRVQVRAFECNYTIIICRNHYEKLCNAGREVVNFYCNLVN